MSVARAGRRLTAASSCLFVCDIQERFRDLIHEFPSVVSSARTLLAATRELQVPAVVTEQYPKALGKTVPELNVTDLPVFEKKLFSMCTEDVLQHLQGLGRQDVILCGIEAHVCVLQTCMDLLDKGYKVHLVVDGISSQRAFDRQVALQRMEQEGAKLTTSESVIFQMAGSADHPHFKAISSIAKSMAKEGNSFWNVR